MESPLFNPNHSNAGSRSVSEQFSNLTLLRLLSIRQQWRRWVGWCSSIQGVLKQASVGLLLLVFVVSFAACENEDNKQNPPSIPVTSDNPLLGTWYLYDEFSNPDWYMKLEFTETNMNVSMYSIGFPLQPINSSYELLVENAMYCFINEDSIYYETVDPGYMIPYVWFTYEGLIVTESDNYSFVNFLGQPVNTTGIYYNKTKYFVDEDTLTIKNFVYNFLAIGILCCHISDEIFTREVRYE